MGKKKKTKKKYNFSEGYIRSQRTFPVKNTVFLLLLAAVQVVLVLLMISFEPQPQDIIQKYSITVEPLEDGSLDIHYEFLWKALDTEEELTWVEIGMANQDFSVYEQSLSKNIGRHRKETSDGYSLLQLYFNRAYQGGDTLRFSFKVNQKGMLCQEEGGYFYEFVPGWFNATPVENYEFKWQKSDHALSAENAEESRQYYSWQGQLECGNYAKMRVHYAPRAFEGQSTVAYVPFDDEGVYDELAGDKIAFIVLMCLVFIGVIALQVYIVDSYVSYSKGRGFLSGYGHPIHTYGRSNPHYVRSRAHYIGTHGGGGFRGGGCACACACACAGGGRAGCSQKDTYENKPQQ